MDDDVKSILLDTAGCLGRLVLAAILVLGTFGFFVAIVEALKK